MNEARYVIANEEVRNRAAATVSRLPLEPKYEVNVKPYQKTRSIQQNRYLWGVVLEQIAHYIPDEDGVLHKPSWWHFRLKAEFGYVSDTYPVKLPDGTTYDMPWPDTSTKFTVGEMADYIEQCLGFAAEHGVLIDG